MTWTNSILFLLCFSCSFPKVSPQPKLTIKKIKLKLKKNKKLSTFDHNPIFRLYGREDDPVKIVEVCRSKKPNKKRGIYLIFKNGPQYFFDHFDEQHFNWACKQGLGDAGTFYEVHYTNEGKLIRLVYDFYINLLSGKYYLVPSKGQLRLIKKEVHNMI